jgi:hypothetical protein
LAELFCGISLVEERKLCHGCSSVIRAETTIGQLRCTTGWVREGLSGADDIFLDLDPDHGLVGGERWARALEDAATRCEVVLFLVSEDWLASKWCSDEYQLANKFNKKLFALLIDDVSFDRLPGGLTALR